MAADDSMGVGVTPDSKLGDVKDPSIKDGKTLAGDDAVLFVAAHQDLPPMTPEIEKRIKRKIDAWMIPLVWRNPFRLAIVILTRSIQGLFTATLAAVDKVQLSTAALYDFREDNKLTGEEFSWLGSILSLGVSLNHHQPALHVLIFRATATCRSIPDALSHPTYSTG